MAGINRIVEVYKYYVHHESGDSERSIKRFEILRERFGKILKSNKLRSIQLAMGPDYLPIQDPIHKMTEEDFNEFIGENTSAKRRKEIYNKYSI